LITLALSAEQPNWAFLAFLVTGAATATGPISEA
jgi:hypothetical protein